MNPLGWLKSRWLLGGLGVFAFSLVAWSVGDLAVFGGWRPFETPVGRAALIAIAAAAGATAGLIRGLFQTREPDPVFRGFVERCLRDVAYVHARAMIEKRPKRWLNPM